MSRPKTRAEALNKEFLNEAFEYRNGELFWRFRPPHHFACEDHRKKFNNRQGGTKAGYAWNGYVWITFHFGAISAHRIIFVMHYGYLPDEVDHINGNPSDNRIENLRAATHKQNSQNMKTTRRNSSGVKGVSFHKTHGKWSAYIRADGKMKHLGLFKTIEEAAIARKSAEKSHYGEFSNER